MFYYTINLKWHNTERVIHGCSSLINGVDFETYIYSSVKYLKKKNYRS